MIILVQNTEFDQFPDALVREVGIDGSGAESEERRDLVHVPGLAALQNEGYSGALFRADQMLLYAGDRQQGRDGHVVLVHATV